MEDISPNCLTILHRVVHSQRFMAGLWNVLGLLHLQQGCDEIEKTLKKPNNQTNRRWICDRRDHVHPQQRQQQADPRVRGQWQESAAKWGEVVRGPGSGSGESYAANPPHPPPFLALVHVKNVVKYYNTDGCLMSPLKEQSGV